jgi:hypothetical protein
VQFLQITDMNKFILFFLALAACFISACKTENPAQATNTSSFALLQQKVITPVCAKCHTAQSTYAIESGLVLDQAVAYANLVGIKAFQKDAAADGLLRVKPGFADSSLLYLKLHGFPANKFYGYTMPMGYQALSIGQQKFIHDWINAGAPQNGVVADAALLDDTSHYPSAGFTPLEKPADGTGFQVETGAFSVSSNFEREIFIYKNLQNPQPILVNHYHTRMRPNSHHLILYAYFPGDPVPQYNVIRDLRSPNGTVNYNLLLENRIFLGGSMEQEGDYWFPQGVALALPANMGIDINTHFINYSGAAIQGEAYANFYTAAPGSIQRLAAPLFSSSQNIHLPPGRDTTFSDNIVLNSSDSVEHLFMLTSHTHQWGKKYQIYIRNGPRNGELLYESTDWSHPLIKSFDPPIALNPGEGVQAVVTYHNDTSQEIDFGLQSINEMNVIYGYYY